MSHISDLTDADVNAGFMFVKQQPSRLTNTMIKQIMDYAFVQQGIPGNPLYDNYIVLAENNGTASDSPEMFPWTHPSMKGRVYRSALGSLRDVDKERRDHERNRRPGQESTRPKRIFLTSKTLVVVVGSGRFLGEHLRFYLEDEGIVRGLVIDMLLAFLSLPIWSPERGKDGFAFCKPSELPGYQFYEDYFNAFVDKIAPPDHGRRRLPKGALTTSELLKRLT